MKAEIVKMTPSLAKEMLKQNVGNRKLKTIKNHYASQMKNGLWKENGEPIIVDINGFIKDGQHRLHSCIEANYSYNVPVIYDVNPNVMDTIDTGTNRSLADVLELNGFMYSSAISSYIKTIRSHDRGLVSSIQNGHQRVNTTNSQGLDYANKNKEYLFSICKSVNNVYSTNLKVKPLNGKEIAWYLHAICGGTIEIKHVNFLKGIYSGYLGASSCTNYAYKKLLNAKVNKTPLPPTYKFNLMARCWAIYSKDDMPITRLNVPNDDLIKIN
mgnify:CR=1 FL=1